MVSSTESAYMGGMGNLLNFKGTDTNIAERAIKHFYPKDYKPRAASVWATEHSIATAFGLELEDEIQYVLHQLRMAPSNAIISLVADSRDIYRFCSKVLADPRVYKEIISRVGRFVVRPDSGKPIVVVNKILNLLGNVFGYTYNSKDYKVLNHNVGVLQGDGMDYHTISELYESIMTNEWSADNLAVGSGGGLMQKWNRDTQRFAIKASFGVRLINKIKKHFDIFKNPITANSGAETKLSKRGELKLHKAAGYYSTLSSSDMTESAFRAYVDELELVFLNGKVMVDYSFEELINVDNGPEHNLNIMAA